jgi:UDP-GlcNAc:undecaprenyl-phosphate GlcNAc-1-phosphate transferase
MTLEAFSLAAGETLSAGIVAASFAVALLTTLCLTPLVRRLAKGTGLVDRPDGARKLQKMPVPLLGGVAVLGGFGVTVVALVGTSLLDAGTAQVPLAFLALGMLCLLGVLDDATNMRPRWKLVGQVISVVPLLCAGLWMRKLGFCGLTLDVGYWGIPLTVIWFVGCINAVNLLDGMDGLAATIGLCTALAIAAIGFVTGGDATVVLAVALVGALAGFLVYNAPPATIYLGDAGSMVIGLLLAMLTLQAGVDSGGRSSLTIMAVLMTVPIADTTLAVIRRKLNRQGISCSDRGHIHHRLLDRGFQPAQVLRLMFSICLLTGTIATVSRIVGWDAVAWIASGALGVLLVRSRLVGHYEWALGRRLLGERLYVESFELPTPLQLGGMTFDAAWNALVRVGDAASVRRLRLSVEGQGAARLCEWTASAQHDPDEDAIAVELTLGSEANGRCRLRMESADPESGAAAKWQLLVAAARRFGRHWARCPQSVPVAGLRVFGGDDSAAAESPADDMKRAA